VLRRTLFHSLPLLLLAACSSAPDTYAPPVQRKPLIAPGAGVVHFVSMDDPLASAYVVKDVAGTTEAGGWRWTYRRPELRFFLAETERLKLSMEFAIPEHVFHDIGGPVTFAFYINGKLLDKTRYEKGGHLQYLKPVPAAMLRVGENFVAIEPDKVWVSKSDGAVLGFVLSRVGFVE
jgi:hypothetical protein